MKRLREARRRCHRRGAGTTAASPLARFPGRPSALHSTARTWRQARGSTRVSLLERDPSVALQIALELGTQRARGWVDARAELAFAGRALIDEELVGLDPVADQLGAAVVR